jgi:hypothetical protein
MNFRRITRLHRASLRATFRIGQYFFLVALLGATTLPAAEMRLGNTYQLAFTDVDQHKLSTSDGHVTIMSVVTKKDEPKAQALGHRVPLQYYGDLKYRLITLVNFQQKIYSPFQGMILALIRHRLDGEAKELQKIYSQKRLTRNPRNDIFVVADFDGKAVSQLGIAPSSAEFAVFIFDGHGRLVQQWNDVPNAGALEDALKEAR